MSKLVTLLLLVLTSTGTIIASDPPSVRAEREPKASEPLVKDGLAIKLQVRKRSFAPAEPIQFTITLKNVSEKPFLIERDADGFDACCELLVISVDTKAKYRGTAEWLTRAKLKVGTGYQLKPGKTFAYERAAELGKWQFVVEGDRTVRESLPKGKYQLQIRVRLGKTGHADGDRMATWVGEITTKPVEFEISGNPEDGSEPR